MGWLGQALGCAVPREVEPVAVVLLFGVVTDYSIFLSRFGNILREGFGGRNAAERGTTSVLGIVVAAGLATSSLVAAKLAIFQVFGPARAVAVLVGALVAATSVPGALAIVGRFVLWPTARADRDRREDPDGGADEAPPLGPSVPPTSPLAREE